jgi:hypothetical protein
MKKIGIALLVIIVIFGGYYYMTRFYGVKNYNSSKADFTLTNNSIKNEFAANETAATAKYVNKAVLVTGSVTENTGACINFAGVSCKMSTPDNAVKVGNQVKIQGRLVGYDSLVEEVQLDQCSVVQ